MVGIYNSQYAVGVYIPNMLQLCGYSDLPQLISPSMKELLVKNAVWSMTQVPCNTPVL